MKRFGVLVAVLALLVGVGATTVPAATKPPTHLKKVGDHWTPWDPPDPRPDAYIIQKGDTLWDLSEIWFEDPFLWPQIWDENRYILDSHWIYPGDPLVVPGRPMVVPDEGPLPVPDPTPPVSVEVEPPVVPEPPAPPPLIAIATPSDLYCSGYIAQGKPDPQLWIAGRDLEREILGEGDVVFLNQGQNHGVRAGDTFAVRRWTDAAPTASVSFAPGRASATAAGRPSGRQRPSPAAPQRPVKTRRATRAPTRPATSPSGS